MSHTEQVPPQVLAAAREAAIHCRHPVRTGIVSAIVTVPIGAIIGSLLVQQRFALAASIAAAACVAWWIGDRVALSNAMIRRSCERDLRRQMDRLGWCWYCHEAHLYRACLHRTNAT